MSDFDYTFGKMPWEQEIESLQAGAFMSASRFLTLMEPEEELALEEAFMLMEERNLGFDLSDLPAVSLTGSTALRLKQESQFQTADLLTAGLDENDPLRLYLQELAAIPAAGDPQLLAERYFDGEHHLAEQIVNLCLSRVVEQAVAHTGHGVLLLDLIQEGSVGLWQSILQYRGGDFAIHADWFIRFYMAKCILMAARSAGLGQMLRQGMEDYLDADQRLLAELGRNPTAEEIAQVLHKTADEIAVLEKMVLTARSMDKLKQSEPEQQEQPEDDQAVEDTAYFQLRQRIMELLATLSPTDAKLLTLRFGLEGGRPMTPVQTGEALGLTPQEVLTREAAALEKLRTI